MAKHNLISAVLAAALGLCLEPVVVMAGECQVGGFCLTPCPAENSCETEADCAAGQFCSPACMPCTCTCDLGAWFCPPGSCGTCTDSFVSVPIPTYTILDLGTFGGASSVAFGINNLGQVVGGADRADGFRHAFLWVDGAMTDLGTLPQAPNTEAWDINNLEQVVGSAIIGGITVGAFLWEKGEMQDLGNLSGAATGSAGANAINDHSQVVGVSGVSIGVRHAFLWEDGEMIDLTANGYGTGVAEDISNAGHIVGGASLWQDGVVTNLGSLGGNATAALGVNDIGQVVGVSDRVAGELVFHAFLWDNGTMTDLDVLLGLDSSRAEAINNAGQVVGGGLLYDSVHGARNPRDLIPVGCEWSRLSPQDINDPGQIVGAGTINFRRHAFLMTPIDADFDNDGDTDLLDFEVFWSCVGGPSSVVELACKPADINRDGHVDLLDFNVLQWVFGAQ